MVYRGLDVNLVVSGILFISQSWCFGRSIARYYAVLYICFWYPLIIFILLSWAAEQWLLRALGTRRGTAKFLWYSRS